MSLAMKPIEKVIAENIVKYRRLRGMKQIQLARASNLHPVTMSRIESAKVAPGRYALQSIALALGCSPTDFYSDPVLRNQELNQSPTIERIIYWLEQIKAASPERKDVALAILSGDHDHIAQFPKFTGVVLQFEALQKTKPV